MFKGTLDTREFDKSLSEYMKFQKRLPSDVVNAKLFFIARNATVTTQHADKSSIESELRGTSQKFDAPLAAILINKHFGANGKKGLTGEKMVAAVEKFIKKRKQSVNFIRAGWKNAIKLLESYLQSKGEMKFVRRFQTPADKEALRKNTPANFGSAVPARVESGPKVWGEISNNVKGDGEEELQEIKFEGLQKAVDQEAASMRVYIERKLNPEHNKSPHR